MTCTELVIFPASDAFLANRTMGDQVFEMAGTAHGVIGVHSGFAVEDRTVYVVTEWKSMEHREVHASSPEYSVLAPSFRPLLGGPSVTQHIHFGAHTSNVFGAPFTEFAFFKVKQDQSKDELHSLLKGMCTSIDRLFSKRYAPCGLGESVENPGTFCLVVGWNTIADHIEVVNRKDSAALMAKITKLSDVDVRHVPLKRFSGETKKLLDGLQSKL